jgi:hypothetical protein
MSAESGKFTLAMRQDKHACANLLDKMAAAANAKGLYEQVVREVSTPFLTLSTVVVTPANAAGVATDNTNFRDQERRAGELTYEYFKLIDIEVIELIKTLMNYDLGDTLDCRDIYSGFLKYFCSLTDEQFANYLELLREKYVVGNSMTMHVMKHLRIRGILNGAKPAHPQDMQIGELLHSVREMANARVMGHVMAQIATDFHARIATDAAAAVRIPEAKQFRTYCNMLMEADNQRRFGDFSPEIGAARVEKVKTVEESAKLTETQTLLEAINKLVTATTAALAKKAAPGGFDRSNRAQRTETLAAEMQAKYGNGKYPLASPCPAHPGNSKHPCTHTWGECKLFLFVPDHGKKK